MNKPVRIQRKRVKGWKMPPNTVYVGRPTKYGNPYAVGVVGNTAEDCIRKFEQTMSIMLKQDAVAELKGKNLACWCSLDSPCHADILLRICNE